MANVITPEPGARSAAPGLSFWLGQKIQNVPLAMAAPAAMALYSALKEGRFDPALDLGSLSKFVGTKDQRSRYRVTDDGIAIIPIQGMLIDRGEWLGDLGGWMTSYEGISEQLRRIGKDDAIKTVVLDIDSGGGMASGMFDLASEIRALGKHKRVVSIAANYAASAAYGLGCSAEEFYVTRDGIAGSIGVISIHMSYEGALDRSGVAPTLIYAGSHKADGNWLQALSHGARAEMSADCDRLYERFVDHVAKCRGVDSRVVRETEARMYSGELAVAAKLADGIKSFDELLTHLRGKRSSKSTTKPQTSTTTSASHGGRMSDTSAAGGDRSHLDAALTAAVASLAASLKQPAAATSPAQTAASTAPSQEDARTRIKGILGCDAAKTRPTLAQHLALETDLPLASAEAVLAKSPEEAAKADDPAAQLASAFAARMQQPGATAQVKPEASGAVKQPSLAEKMAARHAKKGH